MTKAELEKILASESTRFQPREDERWSFVLQGVAMQAFCSEAKDRMRVMAAVCDVEELTEEQLRLLLRASFHSDARYAIYEATVFAAYIHPLARLSATELSHPCPEVASMARTFGTRYASGSMKFEWSVPCRRARVSEGGRSRRCKNSSCGLAAASATEPSVNRVRFFRCARAARRFASSRPIRARV